MAMRVHVAAAYGVNPDAFVSTLSASGVKEAQRTDSWCWITASVWGVDGRVLDDGLKTLSVPSLRVTTVDGAMWHLQLFEGGEQRYRFAHMFHYLRPYEDAGRRSFLKELKEDDAYGVEVTKEMQKELKGLAFDEARERYLTLQAEAMSNALAAVGIPHDRARVIDVLTGRSVTDEELGWDIGNLPRFLDAIGLHEVMPGWEEQAMGAEEEGDDESDQDEDEEEIDYAADLLDDWEGGEPELVDGGPIDIPLDKIHQILRIAWFCDEDVEAALRIETPDAESVEIDLSDVEMVGVGRSDGEIRIGFPEDGGKWTTLKWVRDTGPRLASLPDGSLLELTTESEYDIGRHRYVGPVDKGVWRVEAAYPAVTAETLREALKLSRYVDDAGNLEAKDASDAQAIADTASRLYMLGEGGSKKPAVKGATISLRGKDARMERGFVALCAFRRWFGDTWDTSEVREAAEELNQDWDNLIDQVSDAFEKAMSDAIPKGKTVLEGRAGRFEEVARDEDEDSEPSDTDQALAKLGYRSLGWMTCSAAPGVVIRGYAGEGMPAAVVMNALFEEYVDFYTRFADGSSLTTTTTPSQESYESRGIRKRHFRGTNIAKMYEGHRKAVDELRANCGDPVPMGPSLKALAEAIDEYLVRSGMPRR